MRVLFVASEVAPFAKTGGLADVAGALPQALARRGHEVRVVMPAYDLIRKNGFEPRPAEPGLVGFDLGERGVAADIERLDLGEVPVDLIDVPRLFRRGVLYTEGEDEAFRFAVLCRAALELCRRRLWAPDIIHCNDWQTGLIPVYLKAFFGDDRYLGNATTLLTIHNLAYQGTFPAEVIPSLGLEEHRHLLDAEHLTEGWIGMLEGGLAHSDALSTVSPTYADEILQPGRGFGLETLLQRRANDLVGILNGIDTTVWNPALDRHLPHRYSVKSLWRKDLNKGALFEELDLDPAEEAPLFGMVTRLVDQKGIGLLPGALTEILEHTTARLVVLGSGEAQLEALLLSMQERFPRQVRFVAGYDEPLSHRIEGAADVFLMPSQFEPSGLNQMYSLAYGTPPLVHRTGGLADTVEHWNPNTGTGNGFVFEHHDEAGLRWAAEQALRAMEDRQGWRRLQANGMAEDHSWNRAAAEYEKLYESMASEAARREARPPK